MSWIVRRWTEADPRGLYVDGRDTAAANLSERFRATNEKGDLGSSATTGTSTLFQDKTLSDGLLRRMEGHGSKRIVLDHYEDSFPSPDRADLSWISFGALSKVLVGHASEIFKKIQWSD